VRSYPVTVTGDVLTITEWTIGSLPACADLLGLPPAARPRRVRRTRRRVLLPQQCGELGIDPLREAPKIAARPIELARSMPAKLVLSAGSSRSYAAAAASMR